MTAEQLAMLIQKTTASAVAEALKSFASSSQSSPQSLSTFVSPSPLALPVRPVASAIAPAVASSDSFRTSPQIAASSAITAIIEQAKGPELSDIDMAALFTKASKLTTNEEQALFLKELPGLHQKIETLIKQEKFELKDLVSIVYALPKIFSKAIEQKQGQAEEIPEINSLLKLLLPVIQSKIQSSGPKDLACFCYALYKLKLTEAHINPEMQEAIISKMYQLIDAFGLQDMHLMIFFFHKMGIGYPKLSKEFMQAMINVYTSLLSDPLTQVASRNTNDDIIKILPLLAQLGFSQSLPPEFCEAYAARLNMLDLSHLSVDCYLECLVALAYLDANSDSVLSLADKLAPLMLAKPQAIEYWQKFNGDKLKNFYLALNFYRIEIPKELKTLVIQSQTKDLPQNWIFHKPLVELIQQIFGGNVLYRTDVGIAYELGILQQKVVIRMLADEGQLPKRSDLEVLQDRCLEVNGIRLIRLAYKKLYLEMSKLHPSLHVSYLTDKLTELGLVAQAQLALQALPLASSSSQQMYDPASVPFTAHATQDPRLGQSFTAFAPAGPK
jgi:hypothetical protein